jgi:hypothetical protein
LVHDKLRSSHNLEVTDLELDRNSEAVDECFLLDDVDGGWEM